MLLVRMLPGWLNAKHGFVHFGVVGMPPTVGKGDGDYEAVVSLGRAPTSRAAARARGVPRRVAHRGPRGHETA